MKHDGHHQHSIVKYAPAKVILVGDSNVGKTNLLTRYCLDAFSDNSKPTIGVDFFNKTVPLTKNSGEEKAIGGGDGGTCLAGLKLELWDTAGQERCSALSSTIYRNIHGVIIVFDVTRRDSFEHTEAWLEAIAAHYAIDGHSNDESHDDGNDELQKSESSRGSFFGSSLNKRKTKKEAATPPSVVSLQQRCREVSSKLPIMLVGNKTDLTHLRSVGIEEAQTFADSLGFAGYVETSAYQNVGVHRAFEVLYEHIGAVMASKRQQQLSQSSLQSASSQPSRNGAAVGTDSSSSGSFIKKVKSSVGLGKPSLLKRRNSVGASSTSSSAETTAPKSSPMTMARDTAPQQQPSTAPPQPSERRTRRKERNERCSAEGSQCLIS